MHYRTPSGVTGVNTGSTMRRRSGGSMAYRNVGTEEPESNTFSDASNQSRLADVSVDTSHASNVGDMALAALPSLPSAESRSIYDNDNDSQILESSDSASAGGGQPSSSQNTTISIDSGHKGLIQDIGTTERFTHKWPVPKNLMHFEAQLKDVRDRSDNAVDTLDGGALSLEEGQGLTWRRLVKWTRYKWCLLFSVTTVFICGSGAMTVALLTWFNTWQNSAVMVVADNDILILITLAASFFLFTSLIGVTGTLLNSRPILAIYTFLLWPAFLSLLAVGYTSYRRSSYSLENKLNLTWSRFFTPSGRRIIQDSLECCGFYSAMHEAAPSKTCYLRAPLPGCKAKLYGFERANLRAIWSATFALAPVHLVNMVVALLCSNHVTKTFGNGFTPVIYRLSPLDVKADADKLRDGGFDHLPTVPYSGVAVGQISEKP